MNIWWCMMGYYVSSDIWWWHRDYQMLCRIGRKVDYIDFWIVCSKESRQLKVLSRCWGTLDIFTASSFSKKKKCLIFFAEQICSHWSQIPFPWPLHLPYPCIPETNYQMIWSIVGSLQYLLLTQPDIAFAVNKACQFLHSLIDKHWKAMMRILSYLCGTIDIGLTFSHPLISLFMHSRMQIEWVVLMIEKVQVAHSYSLALI